jgi:hypothetical protein
VHTFGIPKCLKQQEYVDANEDGITVIIITLNIFMCSLESARIGNRVKNGKIYNGLETYIEVEMVVI